MLKIYRDDFGNCDVPRRYKTADGKTLGAWVNTQRRIKNLPLSQKKDLDDLGFVWVKRITWNDWYKELLSYKEKYNNCSVPIDFVTPEGWTLGHWVRTQRSSKDISEDKRKLLDQIGFVWKIKQDWDQWYKALVDYKKEFGNCLVPKRYKTIDNLALGNWVVTQRSRRQNIPSERRKILDDLGFIWEARSQG